MATYEIYCDCKVDEIGTDVVTGDYWPYILWNQITGKNPKRKCCHCGEKLKIS